MHVNKKENGNRDPIYCEFWNRHRYSAVHFKMGLLLVIIGLLWMGVSAELFDFSWLRAIHFWPLMMVLIGIYMVYKAIKRKYLMNKREPLIKQ